MTVHKSAPLTFSLAILASNIGSSATWQVAKCEELFFLLFHKQFIIIISYAIDVVQALATLVLL